MLIEQRNNFAALRAELALAEHNRQAAIAADEEVDRLRAALERIATHDAYFDAEFDVGIARAALNGEKE